MLFVGAMNLVWMAGLAAVMAAEKLTHSAALPRVVGIVLIAAGAIFLAINLPLTRVALG
jgi:predicted metal-binding membrane protein